MKKFLLNNCGIRLFGSAVASLFTIAMMNNNWLALGTAVVYYLGLGFFSAKPDDEPAWDGVCRCGSDRDNPCVCD